MNLSKLQWPSRSLSTYGLLLTNSQAEDSAGAAYYEVPESRRRRKAPCTCGFSARSALSFLGVVLVFGIIYPYWAPPASTLPPSAGSDDSDPLPAPEEDPARPPPLYEKYRERERHFPQHNLSLPYPEGSHAKFLWAANHGSRFGWGNYMEEMVLDAYLAYSAHRAHVDFRSRLLYVFDNYTSQRDGPEIGSWNGKPIPARVPFSALIAGPIIGGSMGEKDIPRAVSREYFFSVCPESKRVVIDTRKIQDTLGEDVTLGQIVERWVAELKSIQSPCVELASNSPALFGSSLTNTIRVLDAFPALSRSPILSAFDWSPLILEGFNNNLRYFVDPSDFNSPSPMETYITPLKGLLAIHVRRGDYELWCDDAYKNAMSFKGFNSFPELPDKYAPLDYGSLGSSNIARKHCSPSIAEIVEKVLSVTEPHITRVYIMTNAPRTWLSDLKRALRTVHQWPNGVGTTRDLDLSWEGKFVSEAVDMHVGQRAEKFIGNGFSSLTSSVVMLRMHNSDLNPSDIHFW
ncbi:hypothetical protein DFH09DRAFT_1359751 [Mycena vulgaris]|nr:hypothetical protein DFH09DRAFT_1359751 [Mycena vulgaris]